MTADYAHVASVLPSPAETPAAIRAVLAANADPAVVEAFDAALDAAFAVAREASSLEPLTVMIRRWWFEAENWRDPVAHRSYLAHLNGLITDGPPPPEQRMTAAQFRKRFGV